MSFFRPRWYQAIFHEIVKSHYSSIALSQISDSDLLVDIFYSLHGRYSTKDRKQDKLIESVLNKISDQATLARILEKAPSREVEIGNRLTNQELIAETLKKIDYEFRDELISKITNQKLIADVARNAVNQYVRSIALDKLTDEGLLAQIARKAGDSDVRVAAVKKLTDQVVLAEVAKTDKYGVVRLAAAEKLEDQSLAQGIYANIAKNVTESNVRADAVKKLNDQTVLAQIARSACDWRLRRMAAERLEDQSLAEAVFAETQLKHQQSEQEEARKRFMGLMNSIKRESDTSEQMRRIKEIGQSKIRDKETVEYVVKGLAALLDAKHDGVCYHAAIALGDLGDSSAVQLLIRALKTGREGVRSYAAEALGKIGDRTAEAALKEAVQGDNSTSGWIRDAASFALERMSPDSRWAKLIPSLEALKPMANAALKTLERGSVRSFAFTEPKEVVRSIQNNFASYTRITEESTSTTSIKFVFDNLVQLGSDVTPATRQLKITVVRDGSSYRVHYTGTFS